jgi:CubicO group peptidase (beta-lactamase class C family)
MKPHFLLLLVFSLLVFPLLAQPDLSVLEPAAVQDLAKFNVPGAAIAIVRGTEVIYSKAVGTANVETGEPVRPEMLFRLGSTTKMLTATAVAGLAVEGKLDLGAPIGKYIDGLPPRIAQVTANQLLSHTAGILDEAPMYGLHDDSALGSGIKSWTDGKLFTAPGRIFSYSNPGYWLAGYLLEALTGKPYADAMEERVFRPLGMTRTTLRPLVAMTYPLATGHNEAPGRKCVVARPAADNTATWPAGSVYTCTRDLARFVTALLNGGMLEGKQALDPKAIALLTAPHARYPESPQSYGYGLVLSERRGVRVWEHGGARSGYGSFVLMAPERRVGIILLTNRTGGNLPPTLDKASALLLPLADAKAAPAEEQAISAEDLRRDAGVYRNGDQRVEIVARDNRLFLRQGFAPETALVKLSERRFGLGGTGAPAIVLVPGPDGLIEYVSVGSRAFARAKAQ